MHYLRFRCLGVKRRIGIKTKGDKDDLMAQLGVELRIEWVKGKSKNADKKKRDRRTSLAFSTEDMGSNTSSRRESMLVEPDGGVAGAGRTRSISPNPKRNSISLTSPVPGLGTNLSPPAASNKKQNRMSWAQPGSVSPVRPSLDAGAGAFAGVDDDDDSDSDPEDSDTPWSCTLHIITTLPAPVSSQAGHQRVRSYQPATSS